MATGRAAAAVGAKLLPLLAKGAAGLGVGTLGVGTGASILSGGLKLTGLEKQLGQDNESQGRSREAAGRFDRTEDEGYKLQSSAPEKFFDFFMGRDTNKIREKAQAKSDARINRAMEREGKDIKDLQRTMGEMFGQDSKLIPKLNADQSQQSYLTEINNAEALVNKALDVQQLEPDIDLTGKNLASLNREYSRLKQERVERKESKQDGILAMQNALANRGYDIQDARDARQSAYDNRVLDITTAREARDARDKQLMLLVQGLNAFGQGFA